MAAHLDLQGALDDDVDLLALVGGQLDIATLRTGGVFRHHVQGLGDPVPEGSGQGVVGHAVGLFDDLPLSLAGDGVADQGGGRAFDDVGHVHAQSQGAAVNEGEGQVPLAPFAAPVFLHGNVGFLRHFLLGVAFDGAQLGNPGRHAADLVFQSGEIGLHGALPPCGQSGAVGG